MTENEILESLKEIISQKAAGTELGEELCCVQTYEEEGLLTYDKGLVIHLHDGTEVQLTMQVR